MKGFVKIAATAIVLLVMVLVIRFVVEGLLGSYFQKNTFLAIIGTVGAACVFVFLASGLRRIWSNE